MILKLEEIHTFLGKSHILHGVFMEMEKVGILALLGRNGVGKSTTIKSIMGLTPPQKGSIQFKGNEIAGLKPHKICRMGIGYVPEGRRIFGNLTVRQNLLVGMKTKSKCGDAWTIEKIYSCFPLLQKRDSQKGRNLSGGEQQMLTIARTLMGDPELLLVDEPTEGLAPFLVTEVIQILRQIKEAGHPIFIVAQALDVALWLANQVYVMSKGRIVFRGSGEELEADLEVRKKYLEV